VHRFAFQKVSVPKAGGGETFSTGLASRSGGRGSDANRIFRSNKNECRSPRETLKALKRSNLHRLSAVISIAALIRLAAPGELILRQL
jgi:hypothetical protein